MILVGIGKAVHDESIAAWIDGKIKYKKIERDINSKHSKAPEWWFYQTLIDWGIKLKDIKRIYTTDSGKQDIRGPAKGKISNTGFINPNGTQTEVIVDHHLAHAWSHTEFKINYNAIVIDGKGSDNWTELTYVNDCIERSRMKIGQQYNAQACLEFRGYAGEFMGDAGKFMGLIPYKDHLKKFNEIMYQKVLSKFSKIKGFDNKQDQINVFYSGGCALNVDWNTRLDKKYKLKIQPHVYDGGLSIGCLRWALHDEGIHEFPISNFPYIQDDEAPSSDPTKETIDKVAEMLAQGKIVGWYQGHGEIGPRALGNRSILMDPSIKDGKDTMNKKIKKREEYRPYGATVLNQYNHLFFDYHTGPYMLMSSNVNIDNLPSITHVDGTCRQQVLSPEENKIYYDLIDKFREKTGLPLLLNTSLNLAGDPLPGKIEYAMKTFKESEMDAICIGNEIYTK
jgi:predicted NodU family carbamoyl transferase